MKNNIMWVGGAIVIIIGLFVWAGLSQKPAPVTVSDPSSLPGIQTGDAPWTTDIDTLRARLSAIGLPALSTEGTVLHIHQHIDIYIDGKETPVPAGVGVNDLGGFISPVHVHDDTGIIHVESPTVETYTLGQFFDIWGVEFSADQIGGYKAGNGKSLQVYVNGKLFEGDPRTIALTSHEEIVVAYGTSAELPNPVPSSYAFAAGY